LLGYLEGDGSFYISRTDIEPVFTLAATEEQYLLFEKIKEYLEANLGLDKYSLFKLKCTQAIAINRGKARNNGKPTLTLIIKNIKLLNNYFIPFFENTEFISKKGLDFLDFKLISLAVYKGSHKIDEIRSLILKLSYTMNNFRLSTYEGSIEALSVNQRDMIANALPIIEYLNDGRLQNLKNNFILTTPGSYVYEIVTPKGDIVMLDSLKEVLIIIGVNFSRVPLLKKQLDIEGKPVEIKGYIVKRIQVFSKR
jgi:LAGLIDADG endonuclease